LEENLNDIQKYGLDPARSKDKMVYLIVDTGDATQLRDDLSTVVSWVYASTRGSDSEVTLLKIDITGLTIQAGNESNGWWYTKDIISPDRITNLGVSRAKSV
jgi:hypothetical protein